MNQNYDQVADLLDQGAFNWQSDAIIAMLYIGAVFDPVNKTSADLIGSRVAVQKIEQKYVSEGLGYGLPVLFQKVGAGPEYQVVVAKDTGDNDPKLLAFIDVNADGSPITIQNTGTLIIRPVLPAEPDPDRPATIGVWIRLSA